MAVTPYQLPTATASSSGVTTPNNAWTDDGTNADFPDSASVEAVYNNFNLAPGGTIVGIELEVKAAVAILGNIGQLSISLSWDGGSTYTSAKLINTTSDTYVLLNAGNSTDLWGRTWAPGDFTNSNFRIRIQMDNGTSTTQISIDYVKARVYYQVSGMMGFMD